MWLELDVSVRKSQQSAKRYTEQQQLPELIVMSELASLVGYPYPVHQISADFQPTEGEQPTYLVVYRDQDDDVAFFVANAITAHMLKVIEAILNRLSCRRLLKLWSMHYRRSP